MIIKTFTFNPFQENTYLIYDETKECVIIDPGCYNKNEEETLESFIADNQLKPVHLINTHGHVDHVCGISFVCEKYGLEPEAHTEETAMFERSVQMGQMFGFQINNPVLPRKFLNEGDVITFGNSELKMLHLPGHSAGSLAFYSEKEKFVITGDVLFRDSIGRTDLPGGDYDSLIFSIREKLLPLGDDYAAYPGHGPSTTLGFEKENNGFLK
jgi:glyoxylase-like metal-dependent hydrolase (beta-lactamase superfamily II)